MKTIDDTLIAENACKGVNSHRISDFETARYCNGLFFENKCPFRYNSRKLQKEHGNKYYCRYDKIKSSVPKPTKYVKV